VRAGQGLQSDWAPNRKNTMIVLSGENGKPPKTPVRRTEKSTLANDASGGGWGWVARKLSQFQALKSKAVLANGKTPPGGVPSGVWVFPVAFVATRRSSRRVERVAVAGFTSGRLASSVVLAK